MSGRVGDPKMELPSASPGTQDGQQGQAGATAQGAVLPLLKHPETYCPQAAEELQSPQQNEELCTPPTCAERIW